MLVAAGFLLAGCDNGQTPRSAAAPQGQAAAEQPSAEQIEIEKYNAYVDAANRGGNFAAILEHRRTEYSKQLKSKSKLSEYYLIERDAKFFAKSFDDVINGLNSTSCS